MARSIGTQREDALRPNAPRGSHSSRGRLEEDHNRCLVLGFSVRYRVGVAGLGVVGRRVLRKTLLTGLTLWIELTGRKNEGGGWVDGFCRFF